MTAKVTGLQVVRRVTLGIALVGVTVLAFLHQRMQGIPSIDALDPFGGLETLLKFVAGGTLIKKIEPGTVVMFGAVVAMGIVLSRFFCGWFCAFGALQGVFGWLGRRIFRRRLEVPKRLDAVLRWIKYPLLALIVFLTWRAGDLVIRPYDPMAAYGHLSAGLAAVWAEFGVGLVVLVLVMLLSMLYERVFCKYLCPLGALNAILSRIPFLRIRREASTCISCSKCDKVCSMNVEVSTASTVSSPECIACMECVTSCPTKKRTLSTTLGGRRVGTWLVAGIGIGLYVAAALVGQGLGMLRFSPKSLQEQASAGALKVEDIKGSSTWATVAQSFGIDLDRLYREAGVDPKKVPPDSMLKDTGKLAGIAGFEADAVRMAVARIIGVPYAGEKAAAPAPAPAQTAAPQKAAGAEPVPKPAAAAAPAQAPAQPAAASQKAAPALVVPADFALEGTMSIADVAAALGASTAAVAAKLGLPPDIPTDQPLRDMREEYGYSMPDLKARITE
jgi:ferredoxin